LTVAGLWRFAGGDGGRGELEVKLCVALRLPTIILLLSGSAAATACGAAV